MDKHHLPVAQPCGEAWDAMRREGDGRHCASCATTVVDLSALTERDAKQLLERARRSACDSICVRYRVDGEGQVEFRSPPPRRGLRELAVGLGLGLASLVGGAGAARGDTSIAPCGNGSGEQHASAQPAATSSTRKPPVAAANDDKSEHAQRPSPRPRHVVMGKMQIRHEDLDEILSPKP